MITVVWDTWINAGSEAEGLALTRRIWEDMRSFDGYVSHELLLDADAPGHVIALGVWRSRADADRVREVYKNSDVVARLTPLLARPRERWITHTDTPSGA
jgi:quinol monooxygenase YgiN